MGKEGKDPVSNSIGKPPSRVWQWGRKNSEREKTGYATYFKRRHSDSKSSGRPRITPISGHTKPDVAPFFHRAVSTILMWNGAPAFPPYFFIKLQHRYIASCLQESWKSGGEPACRWSYTNTSWSWDPGRQCFGHKSSNLFDFLFFKKNHWVLIRYPAFTHTWSHLIFSRAT